MIELIKVDKKIDFISKIADYDFLFKLVKDEKIIGYGTINKDKENHIYIYIEEEFRGNNYGKFLFFKIIEELEKMGYKEIKIKFQKENIQMMKLVKAKKGLHLSSNENEIKYLIPLK